MTTGLSTQNLEAYEIGTIIGDEKQSRVVVGLLNPPGIVGSYSYVVSVPEEELQSYLDRMSYDQPAFEGRLMRGAQNYVENFQGLSRVFGIEVTHVLDVAEEYQNMDRKYAFDERTARLVEAVKEHCHFGDGLVDEPDYFIDGRLLDYPARWHTNCLCYAL